MTTTPELDAAIRVACAHAGTSGCTWPRDGCERHCAHFAESVRVILRSLATPTPEVIEAMARGIHALGRREGDPDDWDQERGIHKAIAIEAAEAAHAALWTHILGKTK